MEDLWRITTQNQMPGLVPYFYIEVADAASGIGKICLSTRLFLRSLI
jgi:hypothetical protein